MGPGIPSIFITLGPFIGLASLAVPFVAFYLIAYWLVCLAVRRVRRGMGRI